jgi:cell division initiation protein
MVRAVFLTPPEIQHQKLKTGRGYDRSEVDKLLEHVTSSYEQVWLERDELRDRMTKLEGEVATFREAERYLSDTLVTAQRAAEELRSEAERETERLKQEALADLQQANTEAQRELDELRARIEQFRSRERELRSSLRAFLEAALRQIEDTGAVHEAPVGSLVDALAPETARVQRDER